jgi:tetratricopeptide (TPR) repeat protein
MSRLARDLAWTLVVLGSRFAAADPDPLVDAKLAGPPHEVGTSPATKLAIPPVPAFDLPPPSADGAHSVKEMRVAGRKLLDSDVALRGYVTWAYDCKTAIREPGMTDQAVQKLIDDDPTRCERPKFYIGDDPRTPVEHSIWVVDVPRPYNKAELTRIKKAERTARDRCEPTDPPTKRVCPPYKVGDQVVVIGAWKLTSPHGERDSNGLLVYSAMKNLTASWSTPGAPPTPTPVRVAAPASAPMPPPAATAAVPQPQVRQSVKTSSMRAVTEGAQYFAKRQWDRAIASYQQATAAWPGNHVAWYGLSLAYANQRAWDRAADAAKAALELAPDQAMYQLNYGYALYARARAVAREDQARRENKRPDEVIVDDSVINFEKPLAHLRAALVLDNDLWFAHYLVGSILRHQQNPKAAAIELTMALARAPLDASPWIALAELYRQWDYNDAAVLVALQGAAILTDPNARSDVWYELGAAYDAKRLDDQAIASFSKALDDRRDNQKARFARGQTYFRKGDHAKAKLDLEEFTKSTADPFFRQQASRMLMDIAAKAARP